jgi:hypothetical protein
MRRQEGAAISPLLTLVSEANALFFFHRTFQWKPKRAYGETSAIFLNFPVVIFPVGSGPVFGLF